LTENNIDTTQNKLNDIDEEGDELSSSSVSSRLELDANRDDT
jgi:hypothetical protein